MNKHQRGQCSLPLPSLHQVAKCLTMQLAVYLAKEVAAILRAVLTHDTKKLYNEGTVHLPCSNYWIQPIYQELLHSSSRYNATRDQWYSNSYNGRKIAIVLKTLLGWTRRLRRIFSSNGRRQGQTDVCSSRLATIEMVAGKATFVC